MQTLVDSAWQGGDTGKADASLGVFLKPRLACLTSRLAAVMTSVDSNIEYINMIRLVYIVPSCCFVVMLSARTLAP